MLCQELRPNSTIIFDNAAFHKKKDLEAIAHEHGHYVLFLPPYSPDLSRIEPDFANIENAANTLRPVPLWPTSSDVMETNWFDYSGLLRRGTIRWMPGERETIVSSERLPLVPDGVGRSVTRRRTIRSPGLPNSPRCGWA